MSAIALRPFLASDIKRCLAIFRASILEIAIEDYTEDQCAAWIAPAEDAAAFGARLSDALTLIANLDGAIVGFASLKGASEIDMLYVDPAFARRGAGAALIDALSRLAKARGADHVSSDVSDTAKPLFEKLGFTAQRRNLAVVGDEWLGNTTMTKAFAKDGAAATPPTRH